LLHGSSSRRRIDAPPVLATSEREAEITSVEGVVSFFALLLYVSLTTVFNSHGLGFGFHSVGWSHITLTASEVSRPMMKQMIPGGGCFSSFSYVIWVVTLAPFFGLPSVV
jgi:hypothetical protein